jgi:guanylate kinase
MNDIIVICGKSGAGKDTIAARLKDLGYNFVVSHTTRPMREGESEGNPYYFINNETMMTMHANDELIEMRVYHTEFGDWFYAVHKDQIKDDLKYVAVLDLEGLEDFYKFFKARIKSFYIDVPDDVRTTRATARGSFHESEWNRRLLDDEIRFTAHRIDQCCDFRIANYNLEFAMKELQQYL